MARTRFIPRPTAIVPGVPFDDPEEAWLWAARAARLRADGAHLTAGRAAVPRPCEPRDIFGLVCRLRRNRTLSALEMGALCRFGALDRPPDPRDPDEADGARNWESGLDRLVGPLIQKGILRDRSADEVSS